LLHDLFPDQSPQATPNPTFIKEQVMSNEVIEPRQSKRGFGSLSAERRSEIARMGGKAVPASKRSFSQNRALAAAAGRKGGQSVPSSKRTFSKNRELAADAGRKGGSNVPAEKRSFHQDPQLAIDAGRKGGHAAHGGAPG
jgi:general stress protein YciG